MFVLFKYKTVVNSRMHLNSKHRLGRTDTWEVLAEVNNQIEKEKQAQQRGEQIVVKQVTVPKIQRK